MWDFTEFQQRLFRKKMSNYCITGVPSAVSKIHEGKDILTTYHQGEWLGTKRHCTKRHCILLPQECAIPLLS